MTSATLTSGITVVIPNWNGEDWLPALFESIAAQSRQPDEVIVVDNGSTDSSLGLIASLTPRPTVIAFESNQGFAAAVNAGIKRSATEFVALVNTDIVLSKDWLERALAEIAEEPSAASVQTKMVDMKDPTLLYDTGNWLRRDGATEQRGRRRTDTGEWDNVGEVWSACAGAAVYRVAAVRGVGGFDDRLFTYLEDVELGLRLRLAGWRCLYVPVVALHAGGGSSDALPAGATHWVERNTIMIITRYFPFRWIFPVIYRQVAWGVHHARSGTLGPFLTGLLAGLRQAPAMVRSRRETPRGSISLAIPPRPWHGSKAGGHPLSPE